MSDKKNKIYISTIWEEYLSESNLPTLSKSIGSCIARRVWYNKTKCQIAYSTFMRRCTTSNKSVSTHLKNLSDPFWLSINRGGKYTASEYKLEFPNSIIDQIIEIGDGEIEIGYIKFFLDDNQVLKDLVNGRIEYLKSKPPLTYKAANDGNRDLKSEPISLYSHESDPSDQSKSEPPSTYSHKNEVHKNLKSEPPSSKSEPPSSKSEPPSQEMNNVSMLKESGDNSPPPPKIPKSKKPKPKTRKSLIPDDLVLTDSMRAAAVKIYTDKARHDLIDGIDSSFDSFLAHYVSTQKSLCFWKTMVWGNWCRNAIKFSKPSKNQSNQQPKELKVLYKPK